MSHSRPGVGIGLSPSWSGAELGGLGDSSKEPRPVQASGAAKTRPILAPTSPPASTDQLLVLLGDELRDSDPVELVVVGGSALVAGRMIGRPTLDIDLLAVRREGALHHPSPLRADLAAAQRRLMARFGMAEEFLDLGVPKHMLELGLPAGFGERLQTVRYGPALTVHFVSRVDHVYLKYLAMVENAAEREKHEADLRALEPTQAELLEAGRWASEVVSRTAQRAQLLLLETLLRLGKRDARLVKLAIYPLRPVSARGQIGAWLLKRPTWCGRIYALSIRIVGDVRRELIRSLKRRLTTQRPD